MTFLRVFLGLLLLIALAAVPAPAPPTFTDLNVGFSGIGGYEVRWGDYDNDGKLDLAIEGYTGGRWVRVYRNTAGGFVEDANDGGLLGLNEGYCIWGDYDNDGRLDLAYGGWSGGGTGSRVYRNTGSSWTLNASPLRGMKGADGVWFDYDNDGDLDLLLTGESYDTGMGDYTIIYRNDGNGVFTPAVSLPGTYLGEVSVGDFDHDGDYDIAITGRTVGTKIYRNDGNGVFTDIGAGLPPMINCSIAWGDYDNDGDLDLVLSGEGPSGLAIDIYRNDNGVFVPIGAGLTPVRLGHITWGDYDNDGFIDLLMVGSDAAFNPLALIYRNNGNGTFTNAAVGLTGVKNQSSADWGELDNDGDLDLVIAGEDATGSPIIKVYRNESTVANTAPTIPVSPTSTVLGNGVTFQWAASSDAQTPAAGLTYNLRVGTTPGGEQITTPMSDLATGRRKIPVRGNAQQNTSWTLKLPPGTYYWSVQAVDNGYLASGWSVEKSVTVVAPPQVTAMTPTPGSVLGTPPTTITLTLSKSIDLATATLRTVRLIRSGGDGIFGNGNDQAVVPASVTVVGGNQIQLDLTGVSLPNDQYRVQLSGTAVAAPVAIAAWTLDEAAGPAAADSTGNGHTGTHLNGPTVIPGKIGNALHLNGVDQAVEIPDSDALSPHVGPSGAMSISCWVRLSALPTGSRGVAVGKGGDGTWEYQLFIYPDATVSFAMTNPDNSPYAEARAGSITTGVWHHLAGTMKKGESVKVWLDGIPVDNRLNFSGDPLNLAAPLRIGQSGPTPQEMLNGDIDDVRIFATELTPDQVQDLASLGNAVRDTGLTILDGEFGGTFPSGNGLSGGNFVAGFTIDVPRLKITAMTPAPGSYLVAAPGSITLTFNANLDPDTVSAGSVRLFRAGPNGILGDGDDVTVAPSTVSLLSPNQIRIALAGASMPADLYGVAVSATPATIPGRVNYWALDEGIGSTAGDSSGAATGPIVGPTWVPGRVGNSLHWNGISDRVIPGATPLAPPWTAGMWVRREDSPSGDSRLFDPQAFSGGTLRMESYNNTNLVGVAVYTVADYPSNYSAPTNGTWVHLTFVGTGGNTQLYVNGALQDVMPPVISAPRYYMGSHGYNTMLGRIDDAQFFDRNLSPLEIQQLASLGGAVRDVYDNRLDGEYAGSFPTGNGTAGGDFLATFNLNTAPGSFSLLSPSNGAVNQPRNQTYSWSAAAGATSYTLEVAFDSAFASLTTQQTGLTSTFISPGPTLNYGTTYYWRVLAIDSGGSTLAAGAPYTFTTVPPAPGAFSLASPATGDTGVAAVPTFSWGSSSNAASYHLEVSADAAFSVPLAIDVTIPGTSYSPLTPLSPLTVYYWRVTATNVTAGTLAGNAPFSMTTAGVPPGAFTLTGPAAGAMRVSLQPTFTWTSSPGALEYRVQVSLDNGFAALVLDQSGIAGTSYQSPVLLAPTKIHYWRVIASNAGGTTSATGAPQTFTTDAQVDIAVGGGCGLTGLEGLLLAGLWLRRRRARSA